jgi:ABC-type Mn2+/Zn2+ transport system permease subunit
MVFHMNAIDLSPIAEAVCETLGRWLSADPRDVTLGLRTIAVGSVCNVSCAVLGCYLVLRRMSMLGDAISHAILPGLVIAFLLTGSISIVPMFVGALVFGMLTAFLTQTLQTYGRVSEDAGMGVVFTSLFALGVVLISGIGRMHLDKDCVFEGKIDLVAIDITEFWGLSVPLALESLVPVLVMSVAFILLFWKELKVASFDPMLATSMGINATLIHYLLMGMVAGTTVAAFEAVGSILVVAMLIVPGATAHLLTDRLGWMILWSAVVGFLAAILGYIGAVYLNTSVAGMMAVAVGGQFLVVVIVAPRHGLLSKLVGHLELSLRIVAEDIIAELYRLEERQAGSAETDRALWADCQRFADGSLLARPAALLLRLRGQLAFVSGGRVELTDAGRRMGNSLVRSHRLWETFLDRNFELAADHLHEPASRIEHFIGPALQEKLARELDGSAVDPHGRSIPPLERDETK